MNAYYIKVTSSRCEEAETAILSEVDIKTPQADFSAGEPAGDNTAAGRLVTTKLALERRRAGLAFLCLANSRVSFLPKGSPRRRIVYGKRTEPNTGVLALAAASHVRVTRHLFHPTLRVRSKVRRVRIFDGSIRVFEGSIFTVFEYSARSNFPECSKVPCVRKFHVCSIERSVLLVGLADGLGWDKDASITGPGRRQRKAMQVSGVQAVAGWVLVGWLAAVAAAVDPESRTVNTTSSMKGKVIPRLKYEEHSCDNMYMGDTTTFCHSRLHKGDSSKLQSSSHQIQDIVLNRSAKDSNLA
ncbi:hypothetical protein Bbelb_339220 [Branchiostoma belcheri]|nr:hypothetical protein Bbelb_339220 [Branchiostoma belcheri]